MTSYRTDAAGRTVPARRAPRFTGPRQPSTIPELRHFAASLSWQRQRTGLTQEQVADAVSAAPSQVSMWERGKSIPDLHHALRLARFYGTSIEDMCTTIPPDEWDGWHEKR
jgi:DNA-binding XRE family transcriptional regulator